MAVPVRVQVSGAAALTELDMRVHHWPTRCAAAGGPEYQTTVHCSSGGWPGRVLWPTSAVLEAGIVAPAGLWCLGSPVLRLHRRVLPVAMSVPPSKGGFTQQRWLVRSWLAGTVPAQVCAAGGCVWSTQQGGHVWSISKVTGVAVCQAAAGVASLDLIPGLSWARGMLLYARYSGLMQGNVPGHVLSNVCVGIHTGFFFYARRYCACTGMCCWWPCLLHPARVGPLSKGGFTQQARVASPSKGGLSARTGACRCTVSWLAGPAPARACAAGGCVWSSQQGGYVWSTRCSGDRCSGVLGGSWRPCMVSARHT